MKENMTKSQAEEKAHELRLSAQLFALEGKDDEAKRLYTEANRIDDTFNPEFERFGSAVFRNGRAKLAFTSFSEQSAELNAEITCAYLQLGKLNIDVILAKFPDGKLNESQWWSVVEPVLEVLRKECEVKA